MDAFCIQSANPWAFEADGICIGAPSRSQSSSCTSQVKDRLLSTLDLQSMSKTGLWVGGYPFSIHQLSSTHRFSSFSSESRSIGNFFHGELRGVGSGSWDVAHKLNRDKKGQVGMRLLGKSEDFAWKAAVPLKSLEIWKFPKLTKSWWFHVFFLVMLDFP
jgi:hypothetical protein